MNIPCLGDSFLVACYECQRDTVVSGGDCIEACFIESFTIDPEVVNGLANPCVVKYSVLGTCSCVCSGDKQGRECLVDSLHLQRVSDGSSDKSCVGIKQFGNQVLHVCV